MKISVIMASWCGNPDRPMKDKLIRAVNSFIKQDFNGEKELIIVADGCEITRQTYNELWLTNPEIKLFYSNKMPMYSGGIRNIGMKIAEGDIICYLDNDDVIGKKHLQKIADQFPDDVEFVYYNDWLVISADFKRLQERWVHKGYGSIGNSSIAHRNPKKCLKLKDYVWSSTGYGHDWMQCLILQSLGAKSAKLKINPEYLVARYAGVDF